MKLLKYLTTNALNRYRHIFFPVWSVHRYMLGAVTLIVPSCNVKQNGFTIWTQLNIQIWMNISVLSPSCSILMENVSFIINHIIFRAIYFPSCIDCMLWSIIFFARVLYIHFHLPSPLFSLLPPWYCLPLIHTPSLDPL